MTLKFRSPYARARVLRLLAETLSRPELLRYEPGLTEFRDEISDLSNALDAGVSAGEALEEWIGDWSVLADFSAERGCLKEWLQTTAEFLQSRVAHSYYVPVCLSTFIRAGIPFADSLPVCGTLIDGQNPERVRAAIVSGESLAGVAADWDAYPAPLIDWLAHAENSGDIVAFHSRLCTLLLESELVWPPQPDIDKLQLDRSLLLMIRFGLETGLPLDAILPATLCGHECAPWWASVQSEYSDRGSMAEALYAGGVVTPLGFEMLRRSEDAGRIGDALLSIVGHFDDGLLYPPPPASSTFEPKSTKAAADVNLEPVEEWIDKISIRGRMAYALLCIEATLNQWNIVSAKVRSILVVFWEFTTSGQLDKWEVESQRAQPYLYAFYEDFLDKKLWHEMAGLLLISELTESQQEALGRQLVCLHGLSANLHSGFESHVTAEPLLEIINIMVGSKLVLPDRSRVSLSPVEEKDGWGLARPRHFFL